MKALATAALTLALLAGCGDDADSAAPRDNVAVEGIAGDGPIDGEDGQALAGTEFAPPDDGRFATVAADDVNLLCESSQVEVTNTADEARHFYVQVIFTGPDGVRDGDGFANPYNVEPGETVRERIFKPSPDHTCRLGEMLSTPADTADVESAWWFDA